MAFYAGDHPGYWSLWNPSVETPWVNTAGVLDGGGAMICEPTDKDCQRLAEAWSTDQRTLSAAKSAHGFHFPARSYLLYSVPAQAAKILP